MLIYYRCCTHTQTRSASVCVWLSFRSNISSICSPTPQYTHHYVCVCVCQRQLGWATAVEEQPSDFQFSALLTSLLLFYLSLSHTQSSAEQSMFSWLCFSAVALWCENNKYLHDYTSSTHRNPNHIYQHVIKKINVTIHTHALCVVCVIRVMLIVCVCVQMAHYTFLLSSKYQVWLHFNQRFISYLEGLGGGVWKKKCQSASKYYWMWGANNYAAL